MVRTVQHRLRLGVLLVVASWGCASGAEIDLGLVHSPELNPAAAVESFRLTLLDDFGNQIAVREGRGAGIEMASALEALPLVEGERYRMEFSAEAPDCSGANRVAGRTLPFIHQDTDYALSMQVGCAGRFSRAPSDPGSPRLLGAAVGTGDGVILAGGAGRVEFTSEGGIARYDQPIRSIERYDLRSGRFETLGESESPRYHPAALQLEDERVVLLGGIQEVFGQPVCAVSAERVWPLDRPSFDVGLPSPRCSAGAVRLDDGVLVVGGAVDPRAPGAQVLGESLEGPAQSVMGATNRAFPQVVALGAGNLALVVSGGETGFAEIIQVREDGAVAFPANVTGTLPENWTSPAMVYAQCETGGGSAYVLGGITSEDVAVTDVWCFLDRPDGGELQRVGTIDRTGDATLAAHTRSSSGSGILLVDGPAWQLLPIDPCACGIAEAPERQGMVSTGDSLFSAGSLTPLSDGTVLLTGGVGVETGTGAPEPPGYAILAQGGAFLFVPEGR